MGVWTGNGGKSPTLGGKIKIDLDWSILVTLAQKRAQLPVFKEFSTGSSSLGAFLKYWAIGDY